MEIPTDKNLTLKEARELLEREYHNKDMINLARYQMRLEQKAKDRAAQRAEDDTAIADALAMIEVAAKEGRHLTAQEAAAVEKITSGY